MSFRKYFFAGSVLLALVCLGVTTLLLLDPIRPYPELSVSRVLKFYLLGFVVLVGGVGGLIATLSTLCIYAARSALKGSYTTAAWMSPLALFLPGVFMIGVCLNPEVQTKWPAYLLFGSIVAVSLSGSMRGLTKGFEELH